MTRPHNNTNHKLRFPIAQEKAHFPFVKIPRPKSTLATSRHDAITCTQLWRVGVCVLKLTLEPPAATPTKKKGALFDVRRCVFHVWELLHEGCWLHREGASRCTQKSCQLTWSQVVFVAFFSKRGGKLQLGRDTLRDFLRGWTLWWINNVSWRKSYFENIGILQILERNLTNLTNLWSSLSHFPHNKKKEGGFAPLKKWQMALCCCSLKSLK